MSARSRRRTVLAAALAVAWPVLTAGCAHVSEVPAWEKGHLAKPEMALERPPLESRAMDQLYLSKEAASGGKGAGGGGCGCN